MELTRRVFVKLGLASGTAFALPLGSLAGCTRGGINAQGRSPHVAPFRVPLPIPPVLQPTRTDADGDYYEITQRVGSAAILPGLTTPIWGYNGIFPGPTIAARRGRRVVIRQRNELPVPVVTHLHGGKTPPDSDGYPSDLILPATADHAATADTGHAVGDGAPGVKDYTYPNDQSAATLWYHDHRLDFTGPQVYRGLAGFYLLRDEIEDALPLPKGDKEVPLLICDRLFNADGSFAYPSIDPSLLGKPGVTNEAMNGIKGDTILVNGAPWPFFEVANTRYRFRLLNASNARVYELALDPPPPGGQPFVQIGSDGGLLDAPRTHDTLRIAPAERFDVVIDFARYPVGTQVTLKNGLEGGQAGQVLRFDIVRAERDESTIPTALAPTGDVPDPAQATTTRRLIFARTDNNWTINGRVFDVNRIEASPRLDSTEIWELVGENHPVHLHLVQFRVLARNGKAPGPYDAGWKDTVYLATEETVRVLARFSGYRGKYIFHCHNLEHEDMMMMANFAVV